jgi:peptidyl-dipeptidase A
MEKQLTQFIKNHESLIIPLSKQATEAYFNATISGKSEDYQKAADLELKINKIYANKKEFAELKQIKESKTVNNAILKRQLDMLYNEYLGKQIDEKLLEKIIKLQMKNENIYATHRVEFDGNSYTDNQLDEILKTSTDQNELKNIYLASKKIGKIVEKDVLKLVALRNQSAQQLGFKNYHTMSLFLSEQNTEEMDSLFDKLDKLTREPYRKTKKNIDTYLASRLGIRIEELKPWHYQNRFFQESPEIYDTDLDKYFSDKDIEQITINYYESINLPIKDMIQNSDLYEKENKYQHAYCINLDRSGDVRVICNIKPNANWMGTMLHEFGHAVYDKYVDTSLPWLLRTHAHIFITEAIAMFFGRLVSNLSWIEQFVDTKIENRESKEKKINKNLKMNLIVFSRWAQVMYRFEKQMYENPKQDLNKMWWDLVEEYQELKRPAYRNEPDWASKIHIALYPVYYHNYMLGELLASQLKDNLYYTFGNYFRESEVGIFLRKKIFNIGAQFHWNELITLATGNQLNPAYFVKDISKTV